MAQLFLYVDPSSGKYVYYDTSTALKIINNDVPTQNDIILSNNSLYLKPGVPQPNPQSGAYTYVDGETGGIISFPNLQVTNIDQIDQVIPSPPPPTTPAAPPPTTPADTAAPAAPPADAPAATAALNTSDPKIASTGTADSDKTGDSPPQKAAQDSITANNVSLGNAYSTQAVNIETNAPPSSAGTSTPGKAGSSPVTTQDGTGLLGRRLHNPLGDFSSYTYNIGLYLMDPNDYNAFIEGDHSVIKNFHLIVQSGGITNGTDSPRAKGFDLDFYIDNLEITTLTSGKETGDDTNSINCSFQVIEPYGFTFPSKLINAVKASINDKAATAGTNKMDVNETLSSLQNHFMLMIKFYGYDVNGKLISGTNYPQSDVKRSDDQSVFERAFPILIKHFSFKLDNKTMVYNLQAVLVSEQISKGVKRGKIQTGFSVKGETVKDVLTGTTSSNPNVVGLIQRLNDQQNEFLTRKPNPLIGIKDQYKIEFEDDSTIPTSKLVSKDYYNKDTVPLYAPKNTEGVNVRASENTTTINTKEREIQISPGTSIFQAISQIITQSTYVEDALKAIDIEETQKIQPSDSTIDENKQPAELCWFNITPQVKWIGKDLVRQDNAYEITYKIQKYKIPYIRSVSHGYSSKYYGPHKQYQYWFTGKNSEIISYEQSYNLLYFTAMSLSSNAAPAKSAGSSPMAATPGQNADPTSQFPGALDAVGSVKSFLYSPGDALHFQLKILGDPDYLMPAVSGSVNTLLQKYYGDDFTINPNSGQVFIEIDFKQTEDYDNKTGLNKPNDSIIFMNYPDYLKTKIKGMTYQVKKVVSNFNKGQFTQDVSGFLPDFSLSGNASSSETAGANSTAAAAKPTVANTNTAASANQQQTAPTSANQTSATAARTGLPLDTSSGRQGGATLNGLESYNQSLVAPPGEASYSPIKSADDDQAKVSYDALGNKTGAGASTADAATGSREQTTAPPASSGRTSNNNGANLGRGAPRVYNTQDVNTNRVPK